MHGKQVWKFWNNWGDKAHFLEFLETGFLKYILPLLVTSSLWSQGGLQLGWEGRSILDWAYHKKQLQQSSKTDEIKHKLSLNITLSSHSYCPVSWINEVQSSAKRGLENFNLCFHHLTSNSANTTTFRSQIIKINFLVLNQHKEESRKWKNITKEFMVLLICLPW